MDDINTTEAISTVAVQAPDGLSDNAAPTCAHHWLIEPATAQASRGRCTVCGVERSFSNQPVSRYDRDQAAAPTSRMDRDFRSGTRSSHRELIALSDEA